MSTTGKNSLPKFLSEEHLLKWLTGSPAGLRILGKCVAKWTEETKDGAQWLDKEVSERTKVELSRPIYSHPLVLVVLWGNGEVEVWVDNAARIRIANVSGHPSLRDLSANDVGHSHYELVRWPNPPDPIVKAAGRTMSDLEIQAVKQAADAWAAMEVVERLK